MRSVEKACPVPARVLWLVRGWESQGCFRNPVGLLNEVLCEHGREGYDFLLREIFFVLRKRLKVERGSHVHIVVRPGYWFLPYPAIREGEDTIQMEGNGQIHPLAREAASEGN